MSAVITWTRCSDASKLSSAARCYSYGIEKFGKREAGGGGERRKHGVRQTSFGVARSSQFPVNPRVAHFFVGVELELVGSTS